jgi:predicted Zn finger-like uncharacterized protein
MALVVDCPHCAKRYRVDESVGGKRVRCQQCGNTFTAQSAASPPAPNPPAGDLWSELGLPQTPPQPTMASYHAVAANAGISNPSGGPTDAQMRLVCCGMLALVVVVVLGSMVLEAAQGVVYLGILVLMPLMLVLGIAGLISPNVVRAAGKYGGHLPKHYKVAGWGVISLSFVLMILMFIGFFMAGFEPARPGGNRPGLTRSQTATVIDRIRTSYEASPNAAVVRNVSFPVFSINQPNPEAAAERALAAAPGYVGGSFRISADRKKISFQYRGEKEIGPQYALLLPGPTGIYMTFTPEFEE